MQGKNSKLSDPRLMLRNVIFPGSEPEASTRKLTLSLEFFPCMAEVQPMPNKELLFVCFHMLCFEKIMVINIFFRGVRLSPTLSRTLRVPLGFWKPWAISEQRTSFQDENLDEGRGRV